MNLELWEVPSQKKKTPTLYQATSHGYIWNLALQRMLFCSPH